MNSKRLKQLRYLNLTFHLKSLKLMDSAADSESEDEERMRCGTYLLKSLLVFINLIFTVVGLVLVGFVVWIHINRDSFVYSRILEDSSSAPSFHSSISILPHQQQQQQHIPSGVIHKTTIVVVITLVVIIVAFGFLGCCGASVESICFLCLCILLVVSAMIAEIVIQTMLPSTKEKMYDDLLMRMQHQVRNEYNRTIVATVVDQQQHQSAVADLHQLTVAWNTLQIRFNCCGASGPRDFRFSSWYNQTMDSEGLFVPRTCCVLIESDPDHPIPREEEFCQIEALLMEENDRPLRELQQSGCHQAIISYIDPFFQHPLLIAIYSAAILLQVIDVVLCCVLCCRIRRRLSEIDQSENDQSEPEDSEED